MTSDAVAVLCTRLESSRLPRKALLPLGGKPAIWHCLSRLRQLGVPVILACPATQEQIFAPYAAEAGARLFTGYPGSPLHRTAASVRELAPEARYIIRATHDDPLIDPEIASEVLSNCVFKGLGYGVCKGLVDGGGIEVIAKENLDWAAQRYKDDGEFISYYVKGPEAPNQNRHDLVAPDELNRPYRLTMDYRADYLLLDSVLTEIGSEASLRQVCSFLDRNPELANVNILPTVSFYTCVKNGRRFIGETVRSVMNSTNLLSEYIIIDDGSDDGTGLEVLRWLGRLGSPPELRFVRETENRGLATRSNEAVNMTRGKYVMRVDADDTLVPGAVDAMVQLAEQESADVVYAHYAEVDESGSVVMGRKSNDVRHAGCALMRRSFIAEARFRDGIRLGDSADLWRRVEGRAKVVTYPQVAWHYRKHPESLTARAGGTALPPMGLR